ncbi:hypothetical protein AJ80_07861 [Polytolypa hystricis UAMH7299]|uniref:NB-ARC domain-containing protein n=1 Tax=Polytolypa hystricis (strain UAMH7299) TaxID=1447883 RepID=A0A2B7XIE5_POLH7|nr:hypothetical protein AJ80_07861 [Polytolypa hystricis UAMH7299]
MGGTGEARLFLLPTEPLTASLKRWIKYLAIFPIIKGILDLFPIAPDPERAENLARSLAGIAKAQASFSEIAVKLNIPCLSSTRDETTIRRQVLSWLSTTDISWLLIYDNAPDENFAFLRDYWPAGQSGSILVTTRSAYLAEEFSVTADLVLGPIDEDSSVKVLVRHLPEALSLEEDQQARSICERLGNFPLALSQMAGYIVESRCPLDNFLEVYQSFEDAAEPHVSSEAGSTTGYQHTIPMVWAMDLSQLEKTSDTSLRPLSLFSPRHSSKDGAKPASEPQSRHYRSLEWGDEDPSNFPRFDPDATDRTRKTDALTMVLHILHHLFPTKELADTEGFSRVRELGDRFYPHVLTALGHFKEQKIDVKPSPQLHELIERLFW